MQLNLNISQIFLPKRKESKGFVSVYEEVVRTDNPITLFVVIQVSPNGKSSLANKTQEFEKLSQVLAASLKRTYISETKVTDYTFEKALNNLNQELSNLAHRGVVGWYKRLSAVVGVYERGTLHVTVAGSGSAMLLREHEFTEISESLSSGEKPHPLKTFVNFASGALADRDVVLLGANSIYNYLSLEKIRTTFAENSLAEATKELINILEKDSPSDQAFANFIIKAAPRAEITDEELAPLMTPVSHTIIEEREGNRMATTLQVGKFIQSIFFSLGKAVYAFFKIIFSSLNSFSKRTYTSDSREEPPLPQLNPKKSRRGLVLAFIVVGILLAGSLLYFNVRNSEQDAQERIAGIVSNASTLADEAEASLIYNDEETALAKMRESQELLADIAGSEFLGEDYGQVQEKLTSLAGRLNKEQSITNVEILAAFEHGPTKLIRTTAGFVALNSFIDSVESVNLENPEATTLTNAAEENLIDGNLSENFADPVMLSESGGLFTLGLLEGSLQRVTATSTLENPNVKAVEFYGSRAYVLDSTASQIYRYSETENGFGVASAWLDDSIDLSLASDLAIDGNIYVLMPNNILKFASGAQSHFLVSDFIPVLHAATRIFTTADFDFIYILEPEENRILVINKEGTLVTQLVSESFSDLKDFFVEEQSKTIYALNGNNLIRFGY